MRQKRIIGSHFCNAFQASEVNELVSPGLVNPVVGTTLPFEGVPEAHESMRSNKHLGKIVCVVARARTGHSDASFSTAMQASA